MSPKKPKENLQSIKSGDRHDENIQEMFGLFLPEWIDHDGGMFGMSEAQICDAAFFPHEVGERCLISNITVLVFLFRGV